MPDYDHDRDGRPPVGRWRDDDPLLDALCRAHPELTPPALVARFPQEDHPAVALPLYAA